MQGASLTSARVEVVLDQIARKPIPNAGMLPAKYRLIGLTRLLIVDFHSDYSQRPAAS